MIISFLNQNLSKKQAKEFYSSKENFLNVKFRFCIPEDCYSSECQIKMVFFNEKSVHEQPANVPYKLKTYIFFVLFFIQIFYLEMMLRSISGILILDRSTKTTKLGQLDQSGSERLPKILFLSNYLFMNNIENFKY
jgi:hypothetical protein